MRAVFSAWFTASLLAVMALLALKALAPTTGQGEPVDEYAQVLRVHLPWLLFCVLMAVAAGSYVREWANGPEGRRRAARSRARQFRGGLPRHPVLRHRGRCGPASDRGVARRRSRTGALQDAFPALGRGDREHQRTGHMAEEPLNAEDRHARPGTKSERWVAGPCLLVLSAQFLPNVGERDPVGRGPILGPARDQRLWRGLRSPP